VLQPEGLQFRGAQGSVMPFLVAKEPGRLVGDRVVFGVQVLERPQVGTAPPVAHRLVSGRKLGHRDIYNQQPSWDKAVAEAGQSLQRGFPPVEQRDRSRRDDDGLVCGESYVDRHVGLAQDRVEATVPAVLAAEREHLR
jgi:hypothetical protein